MSVADTLPVQTAVTALIRLPFVDRDALHDFPTMQAFRSICHAVASSSVPNGGGGGVDAACRSSAEESTNDGRAVLRLLALRSMESFDARRVAAFISTELLVDGGSEFGVGNDRPRCQDQWIALLSDAASQLASSGATHRRFQCGFMLLLGDTLVRLRHTLKDQHSMMMRGKSEERGGASFAASFSSLLSKLVDSLLFPVDDTLHGVAFYFAVLAEGTSRQAEENSNSNEGGKSSLGVSMLAGVANDCVLTIFAICAEWVLRCSGPADGLSEDASSPLGGLQRNRKGPVAAVTEVVSGVGMWRMLGTLGRCVNRSITWVSRIAVLGEKEEDPTDAKALVPSTCLDNDKEHREKLLSVEVGKGVDRLLGSLAKVWHDTEFAKAQIKRECLGNTNSSKSWASVASTQEKITRRLCYAISLVAPEALVLPFSIGVVGPMPGAAGRLAPSGLSNDRLHAAVLETILGRVATVPTDDASAGGAVDDLQCVVNLLSALITVAVLYPSARDEATLWSSSCPIAQETHNIIVHRILGQRGMSEEALRLASLLAGSLLSSAATSSTGSELRLLETSSDQLLDMLRDGRRDGASSYVTQVLSKAALLKPHAVIPALFRAVNDAVKTSDSAEQAAVVRRNAMDVLAALPSASAGGATSPRPSNAPQHREALRLLAEQLLLYIHDDELHARLQAASLFKAVVPEDVVGPLMALYLKRDDSGKRRGAAAASLRAVVTSNLESAAAVIAVVEAATSLLQQGKLLINAPRTPADVVAFSQFTANADTLDQPSPTAAGRKSDEDTQRAMRVTDLLCSLTQTWCTERNANQMPWTPLLFQPLVDAILSATNFAVQEALVKMWSRICRFVADGAQDPSQEGRSTMHTGVESLVGCVLGVLGRARVDEEEAVLWFEMGPYEPFKAVAPLLCLRGLTRAQLRLATPTTRARVLEVLEACLARLLHDQAEGAQSPKQELRRVVLDLIAAMPAQECFAFAAGAGSSPTRENDVMRPLAELLRHPSLPSGEEEFKKRLRGSLYVFCAAASQVSLQHHQQQPAGSSSSSVAELQVIKLVAETYVLPFARQQLCGGTHDETYVPRQVLGECIAVCGVAALLHPQLLPSLAFSRCALNDSSSSAATSSVVTAVDCHVLRSMLGIIGSLQANAARQSTLEAWFSSYCRDIIQSTNALFKHKKNRRMMSDTAGVPLKDRNEDDEDDDATEGLLVDVLFQAVMTGRRKEEADGPAAVSQGAAPSKLLHISAEDEAAIASFAVGCCSAPSTASGFVLQFQGLKLLAAVMAVIPDALGSEQEMARALRAINTLSLMHPLPEARRLAEQLLHTINPDSDP